MLEWFNNVVIAACLNSFTWHQEQLARCEDALIDYDKRLEEYQQKLASNEERQCAIAEDHIAKATRDFEASLAAPRDKEKSEIALARSEIAKFEAERYEHLHDEVEHLIQQTNAIRINIREVLAQRFYFKVENYDTEQTAVERIENVFDFEEITPEDLVDFGGIDNP